jgi:hypothetical protein
MERLGPWRATPRGTRMICGRQGVERELGFGGFQQGAAERRSRFPRLGLRPIRESEMTSEMQIHTIAR